MINAAVNSNGRESPSTEPKTSGPETDLRENRPSEISDPEGIDVEMAADTTDDAATNSKKPLGFYLSFFAINILVFLFSLDSTSVAVAIPVSSCFGPFPLELFTSNSRWVHGSKSYIDIS